MNKPNYVLASIVNDRACPPGYDTASVSRPDVEAIAAGATRKALLPENSFYRISYTPGVQPREEPAELPRLFIQGGSSGSIKMDLSGVGQWLCQSAFAFSVPDESLCDLHIHRGDIAIMEPHGTPAKAGDLVLAFDGEKDALRLVTAVDGILWLGAADGINKTRTLFGLFPYQGVAVGIIRLFRDQKPVPYRPQEFQLNGMPEFSESTLQLRRERSYSNRLANGKISYDEQNQAPESTSQSRTERGHSDEPACGKISYDEQNQEADSAGGSRTFNWAQKCLIHICLYLCGERDEKVP